MSVHASARDNREASGLLVAELTVTAFIAALSGLILIRRAVTCGLFTDELLFLHAINSGLTDSLMAAGSSHPPLVRILVTIVGDPSQAPDWQLRIPSVFLATSCVFVWQRLLCRFIESALARYCVLASIALNPFWLEQGFQCLPYSALACFTSLHCLMWLRYLESTHHQASRANRLKRLAAVVGTAVLLPWTHFFGTWVLVALQAVWIILIRNRRMSVRDWVYANLAIAILTLPTVPIVAYYVTTDSTCPLIEITDYTSYFLPISAYCFSTVTLPGVATIFPLFLPLYIAVGIYLWRSGLLHGQCKKLRDHRHLIAIGFMLGGFVAVQLFALVTQAGMWPRYMLASAWINLPLIVILMNVFGSRRIGSTFAVLCCLLTANQLTTVWQFTKATDYAEVAACMEARREPTDAFLVQSMDLWTGCNHFDQLWLERYTSGTLRTVSGPHKSRARLMGQGLQMDAIGPSIQRLWVYSHLFTEEWLRGQETSEWALVDLHRFQDRYPLAVFQRVAVSAPKNHVSEPNTLAQASQYTIRQNQMKWSPRQ